MGVHIFIVFTLGLERRCIAVGARLKRADLKQLRQPLKAILTKKISARLIGVRWKYTKKKVIREVEVDKVICGNALDVLKPKRKTKAEKLEELKRTHLTITISVMKVYKTKAEKLEELKRTLEERQLELF